MRVDHLTMLFPLDLKRLQWWQLDLLMAPDGFLVGLSITSKYVFLDKLFQL